MARRSSARLRARQQSTTPQPQISLDSVAERDELPNNTPGAFPGSVSPEPIDHPSSKLAQHIEHIVTSPLKQVIGQSHATNKTQTSQPSYPDLSKVMHDTDIEGSCQAASPLISQKCLPKDGNRPVVPVTSIQSPGGIAAVRQQCDSHDQFQFTFRAQSLELSNEARQMMAEKREEAARLKQQLNQKQGSQHAMIPNSRKLAKGNPRVGRFSDVHMSNFRKMDSIAERPSVSKAVIRNETVTNVPASLKRVGPKAVLTPASKNKKPEPTRVPFSAPPKSSRPAPNDAQSTSPTKRVKRAANDDVATSRFTAATSPKSPATPKRKVPEVVPKSTPTRSGATAPTQASLHRVVDSKPVQGSLIPTLAQSSLKSPTKTLYPDLNDEAPQSVLLQSPTRPPSERKHDVAFPGRSLAQSPVRPVHQKSREDFRPDPESKMPMLHRSPVRMPTIPHSDTCEERPARTPMLHRSPIRPAPSPFGPGEDVKPPHTGNVSRLTERFSELRRSPVKSILRTPKRNYTNNLVKIANGTHQATPDGITNVRRQAPMTEPVRKQVNFSASTKDVDGHVFKKSVVPMDIKSIAQNTFTYPELPMSGDDDHAVDEPATVPRKFNRRKTLGAEGLGDFTFRASREMQFPPSGEVHFSDLPEQLYGLVNSRQQSIRQVSEDSSLSDGTIDQLGRLSLPTKKRKFAGDQENMPLDGYVHGKEVAADTDPVEPRSVKRARPNVASTARVMTHRAPSYTAKSAIAINKPGTASRVAHKPSTLTQARLAALAMPKRR